MKLAQLLLAPRLGCRDRTELGPVFRLVARRPGPATWASDWREGENNSTRVIRGGSWRNHGAICTASFRLGGVPGDAYQNLGFRLACIGE